MVRLNFKEFVKLVSDGETPPAGERDGLGLPEVGRLKERRDRRGFTRIEGGEEDGTTIGASVEGDGVESVVDVVDGTDVAVVVVVLIVFVFV